MRFKNKIYFFNNAQSFWKTIFIFVSIRLMLMLKFDYISLLLLSIQKHSSTRNSKFIIRGFHEDDESKEIKFYKS